ncbi:hypothetical protein G7054_g11849 [Neopestalotiopsis clavispora]|nr:hypothetical protein G7054_g11849 [Neopestalotiopsis clavispora]
MVSPTQPDADGHPPGTFRLTTVSYNASGSSAEGICLQPPPMDDPNDPLNWSSWRKGVNWALVFGISLAIFTSLSVQTNFWVQMSEDMNLSYEQLNDSLSANGAGCALGCVFVIPFSKKYGRRSTYILTTAVLAAVTWWSARMTTLAELYLTNLLSGLAGSVNETVAQMTLADLFFVHQRGTINATYLTAVMMGSFLTPMAAGVQASNSSWRWSYYTLAICLTVLLVVFIFSYEETKYVPVISGARPIVPRAVVADSEDLAVGKDTDSQKDMSPVLRTSSAAAMTSSRPPLNTYRQRLRWTTTTPESLTKLFYFPLYTNAFPHVIFASLQYASGVCWLVVMASIWSTVTTVPPYNLDTAQLGYLNVGPFIGNLIGSFYGGVVSDWCVRFFSRRNQGFYEPEMRLYHLLPPAFLMSIGLFLSGYGLQQFWSPTMLSFSGGLFAFGLGAIGDAAFTLVLDTYEALAGECFVVIAFWRNVIGIGIPFAVTPMIDIGLMNSGIIMAVISFVISMLFIPMIIWGKRFRATNGPRYYQLIEDQQKHFLSGRH